jgi:thiamine pyrophosphokinase
MSVLVFANGEIADVGWLSPWLAQATAVVAADGGARFPLAAGRPPDVLIGDLDSFPAEAAQALERASTRLIVRPEDKDETDLELALLHAAAVYSDEILVFGALGGRLD